MLVTVWVRVVVVIVVVSLTEAWIALTQGHVVSASPRPFHKRRATRGGGQNLVVVLAQHLHPFYNIK